MRSKACIHTLTGHTNTVADVATQAANPQVRRAGLGLGRASNTLTGYRNTVAYMATQVYSL